jgi:hypothetical protein
MLDLLGGATDPPRVGMRNSEGPKRDQVPSPGESPRLSGHPHMLDMRVILVTWEGARHDLGGSVPAAFSDRSG